MHSPNDIWVEKYVKGRISYDVLVAKTGFNDLEIWRTMQYLGYSQLEDVHPDDVEKDANNFVGFMRGLGLSSLPCDEGGAE
jgi:hypothetical protein